MITSRKVCQIIDGTSSDLVGYQVRCLDVRPDVFCQLLPGSSWIIAGLEVVEHLYYY